MKFRFCGDLDCPDWVLAEISILSKMTSIKMKLLCVQVIKDMLSEGIDYEKVYKITQDAKFELGDVKASIAALTFILSSAAKYHCDGETLSNELQQLGLPKEHASSLCKSYSDSLDKLQSHLRATSLRRKSISRSLVHCTIHVSLTVTAWTSYSLTLGPPVSGCPTWRKLSGG
uniref:COMM domain-containing protein 4-like isoform X4 n=1 Tax=Crassostrea virginica TaxID=6565 RepID=A0A8B8BKL8_CRAVI|nr:COMM domain-containing protein 4-like isoform X4 [Crassostrea virginica]